MKESILSTVRPVIDSLKYVTIKKGVIRDFCREMNPGELKIPRWQDEHIYPWDDERAADYFLLFNSINFAFWKRPGGGEKWHTEYKGKKYDGAYGLMTSMTRAIDEGAPLLEGKFLREMTEERLSGILRGGGELVLFPERVAILKEIGRGLCERYEGRFGRLLKKAAGSAVQLTEILVSEFPSFNDVCDLDGYEVKFYKRAQLAPAMIYGRFEGKGPGGFDDIDRLTVFADYKLPQVLRSLGVVEYDDELAGKVDNMVMLPPCSREEVEIRCAAIWASELIGQEYCKLGHKVNPAQVDAFLWLLGHRKELHVKPYHLTETIYY
jgi:hypothetical protein